MARRLQDRKTMPRRKTLLCLILGFGLAYPPPLAAQKLSDFAGAWTLNRQLSQFPSEIGFSADFLAAPGPDGKSPVGRAGRGRGGAGGGTPRIQRESQEDAQRVLLLTDEVRMPFDHLTITETAEAITITPDRAPARTFRVGGKDEEVSLGRVMATVNTSFDAGRLVVLYIAETGRQLRYAYSLNASPKQLIVDVEFIERGGGDKVRRVYRADTACDRYAYRACVGAFSRSRTSSSHRSRVGDAGDAQSTSRCGPHRADPTWRRRGGPECGLCGVRPEAGFARDHGVEAPDRCRFQGHSERGR